MLDQDDVELIYSSHRRYVDELIRNINQVRHERSYGYQSRATAMIYVEILEHDPSAMIFFPCFSQAINAETDTEHEMVLHNLANILPIYLTFKDVGYANLQTITPSLGTLQNYLPVFRLMGNLRAQMFQPEQQLEQLTQAIFPALLLTGVLLENNEDISYEEVQELVEHYSTLATTYMSVDGIEMLQARREGIIAEWDDSQTIRNEIELFLNVSGISQHLLDEITIAEYGQQEGARQILIADARRRARMETHRLELEQRRNAVLSTLPDVQNTINTRYQNNLALINNTLNDNINAINQRSDDMIHDIKYCGAAGNMFATGFSSLLSSPGTQNLQIGIGMGKYGPDLRASHTSHNTFGSKTRTWSYQQEHYNNEHLKMVELNRINSWWNTRITQQEYRRYISVTYLPNVNIIKEQESAASTSVGTEQAQQTEILIINPYVAAKLTGDTQRVAIEKNATADIGLETNTAAIAAETVTKPSKSIFSIFKKIITDFKNGNIESVRKRLQERDRLLQEVHGVGYIPESTMATIAGAAMVEGAKQIFADVVEVAKFSAASAVDHALIQRSVGIMQQQAMERQYERIESVVQNVTKVVQNPSIVVDHFTNRTTQAAANFEEAFNSGNYVEAGTALGDVVHDVYALSTSGAAASKIAVSGAKSSSLLFKYDKSRLFLKAPVAETVASSGNSINQAASSVLHKGSELAVIEGKKLSNVANQAQKTNSVINIKISQPGVALTPANKVYQQVKAVANSDVTQQSTMESVTSSSQQLRIVASSDVSYQSTRLDTITNSYQQDTTAAHSSSLHHSTVSEAAASSYNEFKTTENGGIFFKGVELGAGVNAYRGKALGAVDPRLIADKRLVVEMPYVGKGGSSSVSLGFNRNHKYYWKEIVARHPEAFSEENRIAIRQGKIPAVDHTFLSVFPQYEGPDLSGRRLFHHHIGGGTEAFAVPAPLHTGFGGIHTVEKQIGVHGIHSEVAEVLERLLKRSNIGG